MLKCNHCIYPQGAFPLTSDLGKNIICLSHVQLVGRYSHEGTHIFLNVLGKYKTIQDIELWCWKSESIASAKTNTPTRPEIAEIYRNEVRSRRVSVVVGKAAINPHFELLKMWNPTLALKGLAFKVFFTIHLLVLCKWNVMTANAENGKLSIFTMKILMQ